MQKSSSSQMAFISARLLLAATSICVLLWPQQTAAQGRNFPSSARPGQSSAGGPPAAPGTDPSSSMDMPMGPEFTRDTMARREAARKLERKKRMVDSANRLLALTQQLRVELATREATPEDAKRLDEIARLARTVKDQMRN